MWLFMLTMLLEYTIYNDTSCNPQQNHKNLKRGNNIFHLRYFLQDNTKCVFNIKIVLRISIKCSSLRKKDFVFFKVSLFEKSFILCLLSVV